MNPSTNVEEKTEKSRLLEILHKNASGPITTDERDEASKLIQEAELSDTEKCHNCGEPSMVGENYCRGWAWHSLTTGR